MPVAPAVCRAMKHHGAHFKKIGEHYKRVIRRHTGGRVDQTVRAGRLGGPVAADRCPEQGKLKGVQAHKGRREAMARRFTNECAADLRQAWAMRASSRAYRTRRREERRKAEKRDHDAIERNWTLHCRRRLRARVFGYQGLGAVSSSHRLKCASVSGRRRWVRRSNTPEIMDRELWVKSGHRDSAKTVPATRRTTAPLAIKPMSERVTYRVQAGAARSRGAAAAPGRVGKVLGTSLPARCTGYAGCARFHQDRCAYFLFLRTRSLGAVKVTEIQSEVVLPRFRLRQVRIKFSDGRRSGWARTRSGTRTRRRCARGRRRPDRNTVEPRRRGVFLRT